MNKKLKELVKILIFFSLGVFVSYWVYSTMSDGDKEAFWGALGRANYFWVFLSIFTGTIAHYVRSLRWKMIIEPFGYRPKQYNLFFAVMNMYFFNAFVPRLGEVTRCALLKNYEKIPVEKSLGTVVAERAMDMLMFALLLGITALLKFDTFGEIYIAIQTAITEFLTGKGQTTEPGFFGKYWKYMALAAFALGLGILFLLRKNAFVEKIYEKIMGLIKGFWTGLKSTLLVKNKPLFAFYTILIWVLYFIMTYTCFFALPETVTYNLMVPYCVMIFGTFAIMATPNGLGAFPLVVGVLLSLPEFGGVDKGTGNALGWIIWGAQEMMVISVGLIVMVLIPIFNKKPRPTDAAV